MENETEAHHAWQHCQILGKAGLTNILTYGEAHLHSC